MDAGRNPTAPPWSPTPYKARSRAAAARSLAPLQRSRRFG